MTWLGHPGVASLSRADHVFSRAKAVVINGLWHAVGIHIKQLANVRQAVPLGRILQVHHDQVVTDNVGVQDVVAEQPIVHVGPPVAQRGS